MSSVRHDYKATTRYLPLAVIAVWVFSGACLYAFYALRTEYVPPFEKQILFWSPWLLLAAVGVWAQFDFNRRYKPIDVTEAGIWFGVEGEPRSQLLRWEEIDRVEPFPLPGHPRYSKEKGGIRLFRKGRPFLIYDQLGGFEQFRRTLEARLVPRGVSVPPPKSPSPDAPRRP